MESTDYKSRLISELYTTQNEVSVGETLEEMKDIGDDIFLGPIYDSFIKNKANLLYEHVDVIRYFKGESRVTYALKMLKEIPLEDAFEIECLYDIFEEEKYFNEETIRIGYLLVERASTGKEDFYFIQRIVSYFRKIKQTEIIKDLLFSMLTGEASKLDEDEKLAVLSAWIESDKEINFDTLISLPFSNLGDNFECILARFIKTWKGPKIDRLKRKIEESGNSRSKEILRRNEERKRLENETKKRTEEDIKISQFKESNAELIKEIIELRKLINSIFLSKYSKKLFKPQDELALEIFAPDNEAEFQASCIRLRDIFQDIESFAGDHGLTLDEQKKQLPDAQEPDLNKGVNAFFLFLVSRGYTIDSGMFGGRDFHNICNLGGSHIKNLQEALLRKLKKLGWEDLFLKSDFGRLQSNLLGLYKNYLLVLKSELEKT